MGKFNILDWLVEYWLPVKGYEGFYEVSNWGRVRSVDRRNFKGKILHQYPQKKGYLSISLYLKGAKTYKIHRLVAEAFLPNPNNLSQVNHKDENKTNNCVWNLEWCTPEYNINYGLGKYRRGKIQGKQREKPVIVIDYKTGLKLFECTSLKDASLKTGVSISNISSILHNRYGYHQSKGYTFSFSS